MSADALVSLEPRKTPLQARSAVTVEAIYEATIQVLLTNGIEQLTTTRIAARAGVSVGTLYQYYPNKQSLLFAVLEHHLNNVARRVEAACDGVRHKPLAQMVTGMVEAYVDAKMARADISVALYQVAADIGGPALSKRITQRSRKAIAALLETAPDIKSPPDKFVIDIMLAAMTGVMRTLLEASPSPATVRRLREELVLLCHSYLAAAATRCA